MKYRSISIKTLWQEITLTSSCDRRIGAYSISLTILRKLIWANVIKLFCAKFANFRNKPSVRKTWLEKLAGCKHSSLLRKFVNHERKKFYNIGTWPGKQNKRIVLQKDFANELEHLNIWLKPNLN
jgi:hypothetical protein